MAGDWLKMTHALPEKPEVLAIAGKTGLSRFEVVGRLFILWRWFDNNTIDGNAESVTLVTLNECLFGYGDATKFTKAVSEVHWLIETETGVQVEKFDEHISESAKQRAQTAKRVAKSKSNARANGSGNAEVTLAALPATLPPALPREEKRREEKVKRATRLPTDWTPSPEDLEYAAKRGLMNGRAQDEVEKFRDWWAAAPGQKGVKADWHATWRTWVRKATESKADSSDIFARSV